MSELRPASQIEPISGAVAQLGERELCKLEVVGSIPIGSTSLRCKAAKAAASKPNGRRRANAPQLRLGKPRQPRMSATKYLYFEHAPAPKCARMFVSFEIVKAGLAGLHNRLI